MSTIYVVSFCVGRTLFLSLALSASLFYCWWKYVCACTINYVSDDLQIDYYPFKSTPMHGSFAHSQPIFFFVCIYLFMMPYLFSAVHESLVYSRHVCLKPKFWWKTRNSVDIFFDCITVVLSIIMICETYRIDDAVAVAIWIHYNWLYIRGTKMHSNAMRHCFDGIDRQPFSSSTWKSL